MAVLAINNPIVGEVRSPGGEAEGGVAYGVFVQDTQLTAANMNNLAMTNIELVAAPGAGLAVLPVAVHCFLDFGSAAFVQTNGTDALAILYNGGSEISELGSEAQMTAFIEATADASLTWVPQASLVPEANAAIDLDNNGAAEYTTGTGCTVSIRVYYRIVPMAAFS